MTDPATLGSIVATWKLLGSLYETYQEWAVRRRKSKEALELQARAERLMRDINRAILSGASSDDPDLIPMVREFRALIADEVKPAGYEMTTGWIRKSGSGTTRKTGTRKTAAKKPAARKAPAARSRAKIVVAHGAKSRKPKS